MHLPLDSYEELRALHQALCEARFHPEPALHPALQSSPVSAATAEKVYDLLIAHAPSETEAENWRRHRTLSPHSPLMPVVESWARQLAADGALSQSERAAALRARIAPFRIESHHLDDLFERVGQRRQTLW